MSLSFANIAYQNKHHCVSWSGLAFSENEQFSDFLKTQVTNRLDDVEANDEFRRNLSELELTGMGQENLASILNADAPEEPSWAAGEALAEAFLEEAHEVVFPWNMERDKRNPSASLPGADIIGLIGEDDDCRLALGEVKTSSERKHPPQVMSKHRGMECQLDKLANDSITISQILKWLFPRVQGTQFQNNYERATTNFFNSANKSIALFGVLIRDTEPQEKDLCVTGKSLSAKLSEPTTCQLSALYTH